MKERKNMTLAPITTLKPTPPSVADDPRWTRIVARDKTADGHLWYSVSTTGVYCRPSCSSRIANPSNVQLHNTLEDAKATGFRACRRCNPDGPSIESENAALVARACRIIEQSEEVPSLAGRCNRPKSELLPSHIQGRHQSNTEGICRRPPCEEDPAGISRRQHRHRYDL
jgi:methylphosphotriester-DNA--protein-cysteine methyltransferase